MTSRQLFLSFISSSSPSPPSSSLFSSLQPRRLSSMILRETEPHRKQRSKRLSPRQQPAHRCSAAASPILAEAFGVPPAPAKHERRCFFFFSFFFLCPQKLCARSINKGGASLSAFLPPSPLCVPPLLRVSLLSPSVFPVSPDLLPLLGGMSPERMWWEMSSRTVAYCPLPTPPTPLLHQGGRAAAAS